MIAVSDRRSSPLARVADLTLVAPTESPQFFPSYAASVGLLEMLLGTLIGRAGPGAVERINRIERTRAGLGDYRDPEERE